MCIRHRELWYICIKPDNTGSDRYLVLSRAQSEAGSQPGRPAWRAHGQAYRLSEAGSQTGRQARPGRHTDGQTGGKTEFINIITCI